MVHTCILLSSLKSHIQKLHPSFVLFQQLLPLSHISLGIQKIYSVLWFNAISGYRLNHVYVFAEKFKCSLCFLKNLDII